MDSGSCAFSAGRGRKTRPGGHTEPSEGLLGSSVLIASLCLLACVSVLEKPASPAKPAYVVFWMVICWSAAMKAVSNSLLLRANCLSLFTSLHFPLEVVLDAGILVNQHDNTG